VTVQKRHLILLAAVLVGLNLGIVFVAFSPREPEFQGRSLREWLQDYGKSQGQNSNANEAFQQMGTNALPRLLAIIRSPQLSLKERFLNLARSQNWFKVSPPDPIDQRTRAGWALYALGPASRSAMPELVQLLQRGESALPAVTALSGLMPESAPVLINAFTNQDGAVRRAISSALLVYVIRADRQTAKTNFLPAFVRNLKDKDYIVRSDAAGALASIGDPAAIPLLRENLRDSDAYVRAMTAQALGSFGARARAASSELQELLKDADPYIHEKVVYALGRIDPEGAAKAAVQELGR